MRIFARINKSNAGSRRKPDVVYSRIKRRATMGKGVIGTKSGRDAVRFAYAFLHCDFLLNPEVTLMDLTANTAGEEGYVFSQEMVAGTYDAENMPTFKELYRNARKNEFSMVCVGAFDEEDKDRVTIAFAFDGDAGVTVKYSRPFSDDANDIRRLIDYMENYQAE